MLSDNEYAMRLEGVSKRYFLNPKKPWRLRDLAARPRTVLSRLRLREPFWALRDVTLSVRRGEILGVIGRNGSGKTTLLRVMVGISPPTTGTVNMHGRYAALLELGSGFHPNATGRENAYLNALFMGLPKAEAREKVPEIIEFSGLDQFADQPMRTYSSGMYVRLGFSVAVHVQPEILLIDEVLAVGDADFQNKCYDHFAKLKEQRTTIVMVTHGVGVLKEFADRVVLLEGGRVVRDGDPEEVVDDYMRSRVQASPRARRVFQRALEQRGLIEAVGEPTEAGGESSGLP
jgi:ABC-type polysaccharide/polyol phosphate transport system ATPase subunit